MDENKTRSEEIHEKGFDMNSFRQYSSAEGTEYKSVKVGVKTLDDAVLNLGSYKKAGPRREFGDKNYILNCLARNDVAELRAISNYYYNVNGIYKRVCNYTGFLYRYDWYVEPNVFDSTAKTEKILKDFSSVLNYLDNSNIKKTCGEIALEVVKNGCYYGYLIDSKDRIVIQQLPANYCRSRYNVGDNPAVEFNMKFFDTFSDINYRMKVLNLFPNEFKKGYMLYKQGKLTQDITRTEPGQWRYTDTSGWYLLDPEYSIKFNLNGNDTPPFVTAIPSLLDLDEAQELDRRKQMQKLLKVVVQTLPLDKNGDLIFDVDEARDIHNNAVEMLKHAVGTDVLTTFTDVSSIDLSDSNTATSTDDLERIERAAFNSFGISQNLFNTDGNLSLEKSILNDESMMRDLLLQIGAFYNRALKRKSVSKKYSFYFHMLETTQYNYKEVSKMYKEQAQSGCSKMLPQIALGHSQSFILNTAVFENEILNLSEIMIPPLMSSTLSSEDILGQSKSSSETTSESGGRPEKPDDEKSEKTIANKESMS